MRAGVCAECNWTERHHPGGGPCNSEPGIPCGGYRDAGVYCGCDCGCMAVLTEGNVMREDITANTYAPWETIDDGAPRVHLLICVNCYVGQHKVTP